MANINYAVGNNWGSGFIGNMIVPGGDQGLHGWTIEFDASFAISSIWGAEIVSHVGNHYVIRNLDWNATVPAGGQASFGFQATPGAGGTAATGLVIDGAAVTPPPPPPPVVPTISVGDASVSEGNSGTSQLAFTVTLSQATTGPVTVHYSTGNGTATAGSDYTAVSGTLTFAAGETSKTISVPIAGDTLVEANETLSIALSSPSGATIAHGSATGTIINDDVAPPPATGGAALGYAVDSNWGSGFTGAMTVTAGSGGLNGWTVAFDASATITNIWNAQIVSHVGNHYVVSNATWNGQVAAGQAVSFGFQATPGSTRHDGIGLHGQRRRRRPRSRDAAARAADPCGRRLKRDGRQQRHQRPRLHRHAVGRRRRARSPWPMRPPTARRRPARITRPRPARSPSPRAKRRRWSMSRSPATPRSRPTRP